MINIEEQKRKIEEQKQKTATIIKRTRSEMSKEYTQEYMSEQLGLSTRQAYANIENGKTEPSWGQMVMICEALHCDIGYLMGEYESKKRVVSDVQEIIKLGESTIEKLETLSKAPGLGILIDEFVSHEDFIRFLLVLGMYICSDNIIESDRFVTEKVEKEILMKNIIKDMADDIEMQTRQMLNDIFTKGDNDNG